MNQPIYLVVAMDENSGIGKHGVLPWHFSKELKYFANLTTSTKNPTKRNMVIMGRGTWESIPEKFRPLPGRKNVVLTRNEDYETDDAEVVFSIEEALEKADEKIERIFIIGGGKVFEEMVSDPIIDGIYLTRIHNVYECDTTFPKIVSFPKQKKLGEDEEKGITFEYFLLER